MTQVSTDVAKPAQMPELRSTREGQTGKNRAPRSRRYQDDCVGVYCPKCGTFLGCPMVGAEAGCIKCSTPTKDVWVLAVRPDAQPPVKYETVKKRKYRAGKAA